MLSVKNTNITSAKMWEPDKDKRNYNHSGSRAKLEPQGIILLTQCRYRGQGKQTRVTTATELVLSRSEEETLMLEPETPGGRKQIQV